MTTHYNTARRKAIRNLRSAGWEGAKFTAKVAEKSAEGLFRWATTDHSGISKAMMNMPELGIIDSIKVMLISCCYVVVYAIAMGIAVFVTFALWIPFLLGILF